MRAVVMRAFGGSDVLEVEDVPVPVPGAGEALLRVAAVEVARTRDVATRTGCHPFSRQVSLPHVLGGDFAGTVAEIGTGVDPALVGARCAAMNAHACGRCAACRAGREYECTELAMIGIHRWGAYADYALVPVDSLHLLPDDIPLDEAAALAATGPIAWTQLRTAAVPERGSLLVSGISGSLGSVLAALATRHGIGVVGSTRRPERIPSTLQATLVDPTRVDVTDVLIGAARGGLDAVIDNVGAPDVFDRYLPALRNGGRIVVSGAIDQGGSPSITVPLGSFYVRSLSLLGVRTASAAATKEFWAMVQDGFRLPAGLLHRSPLEQAAAVHDRIAGGGAAGHNLLVVDEELR